MAENLEQRKSRLALFARNAIAAKTDYQKDSDAVRERTARLREERLERDAVIPLPAPTPKVRKVRKAGR